MRPREIVPYCQGGYRAAHAYVALKLAGYPKREQLLRVVGGMGQSRRPAKRASAPQELSASRHATDPDSDRVRAVSRRTDKSVVGNCARSRRRRNRRDAALKSVRVPVGCAKAARRIVAAIVRYRPRAVIGLGEGGRPARDFDRADRDKSCRRARRACQARRPGYRGGRARRAGRVFLALADRAESPRTRRKDIPAQRVADRRRICLQRVDVRGLHHLRRKPRIPVGFIHVPYEARQAGRHRSAPSMPLATMESAVRIAIAVTARSARAT